MWCALSTYGQSLTSVSSNSRVSERRKRSSSKSKRCLPFLIIASTSRVTVGLEKVSAHGLVQCHNFACFDCQLVLRVFVAAWFDKLCIGKASLLGYCFTAIAKCLCSDTVRNEWSPTCPKHRIYSIWWATHSNLPRHVSSQHVRTAYLHHHHRHIFACHHSIKRFFSWSQFRPLTSNQFEVECVCGVILLHW